MPPNQRNPFGHLGGFLGSGGQVPPPRPARQQALRQVAERLGLEFAHRAGQQFEGNVRFPSALTSGTTGVENVVSGTWEGLQVRMFDRWSYVDQEDPKTHRRHREWSRYSCLLTRLALKAPETFHLEREGVFGRLADHIGLHDIELELEDFNRAFTVHCKDRKFATDVLDQQMMSWLLERKDDIPRDVAFQVDRRQLMLYGSERTPSDLLPLLQLLKDFVDHFPAVAFSLYGVEPKEQPPN
jgi:Protein of unknown function (DUF3137)